MARTKNPNYESREMLLERVRRQKQTIKCLQIKLDMAKRTVARITELAVNATREISSQAWCCDGNGEQTR